MSVNSERRAAGLPECPPEFALSLDDQVKMAQIERDQAQAESFRMEAAKNHWQAGLNEHMASYQEAQSRAYLKESAFKEAADGGHRIYHLMDDINGATAHECIEYLSRWARLDIGQPVEIVITTLGGSAMAGMALFDTILALRQKGLHVTTTVRGTAASMGAILLQAADKRVVGPGSTLLIHKIQAGVMGSLDQLDDMSKWFKLIQEQVNDIFAERCANAPNATKPLTRDQIKQRINRTDWSVGPKEAVELGLADEIG